MARVWNLLNKYYITHRVMSKEKSGGGPAGFFPEHELREFGRMKLIKQQVFYRKDAKGAKGGESPGLSSLTFTAKRL